MTSILILTHGGLARELLAAARVIVGELDGIEALSLDWNDDLDAVRTRVRSTLERLDLGDGVLVLTDMFGGTPCNVAAYFQDPGHIEVVSGVNLPMVLRLACRQESDVHGVSELARWLEAKGRQSVRRLAETGEPVCVDRPGGRGDG